MGLTSETPQKPKVRVGGQINPRQSAHTRAHPDTTVVKKSPSSSVATLPTCLHNCEGFILGAKTVMTFALSSRLSQPFNGWQRGVSASFICINRQCPSNHDRRRNPVPQVEAASGQERFCEAGISPYGLWMHLAGGPPVDIGRIRPRLVNSLSICHLFNSVNYPLSNSGLTPPAINPWKKSTERILMPKRFREMGPNSRHNQTVLDMSSETHGFHNPRRSRSVH